MKKILRAPLALCCLSFCLFVSTMHAHTAKTFISPRSQTSHFGYYADNCLARATLFPKKTDHFFTLNGFYQTSLNKKSIGRYFGVNEKHSFVFGDRTNQTSDVFFNGIINQTEDEDEERRVILTLKPHQTSLGILFSYQANLEKFLKGLSFGFLMPVTSVKNSLSPRYAPKDSDSDRSDTFTPDNLENLLTGNFEETEDVIALQSKLTHAKFFNRKTATGLADVSTFLKYHISVSANTTAVFGLHCTIPTGNKARGEFLFEPIYGNGHHVGIGTSTFVNTVLWEKNDKKIEVSGSIQGEYLLSNKQKRTLGLKGHNFGHYRLLGKNETPAWTPLVPAANILTMNVGVYPGMQVALDLQGNYRFKKFCIGIGYGLFLNQDENVVIKDAWKEETYGIANPGFDTGLDTFGEDNDHFDARLSDDTWIKKSDLDITSAATPSQLSHKLSCWINGRITYGQYDVLVKGGGYYQIPSRNSSFEFWGISGMLSLAM